MSELKGRWITVRGVHIFIEEGKSTTKAVAEKFGAYNRSKKLTQATIKKGEKVNYNDRQDIDDEQREARRDYWTTREKAQKQARKNYDTKIKGRQDTLSEKRKKWEKYRKDYYDEEVKKGNKMNAEGEASWKTYQRIKEEYKDNIQARGTTPQKYKLKLDERKKITGRTQTKSEKLENIETNASYYEIMRDDAKASGDKNLYQFYNAKFKKYNKQYDELQGEKTKIYTKKQPTSTRNKVANAEKQLSNLKNATNKRIALGKAVDELENTKKNYNSIIAGKVVKPKNKLDVVKLKQAQTKALVDRQEKHFNTMDYESHKAGQKLERRYPDMSEDEIYERAIETGTYYADTRMQDVYGKNWNKKSLRTITGRQRTKKEWRNDKRQFVSLAYNKYHYGDKLPEKEATKKAINDFDKTSKVPIIGKFRLKRK